MIATFSQLGSMGELGNQMFQVAATIGYARKNGLDPVFPVWNCRISGRDYTKIFKNPVNQTLHDYISHSSVYRYCWDRTFNYQELKYVEIPTSKENINLVGYFQSEKYFEHCKEEIRNHFAPSQKIEDYLKKHYSDIVSADHDYICVHVRTAKRASNDYDVHEACDSHYLEKALEHYDKNRLHVVFADNVEQAMRILPADRNYKVIENEANYIDLFLMTYFKDYVISASTFGWWAAWLSKFDNPNVTIMKDWFNPNKSKAYLNDNSITPERWKAI